MSHLLTYIYQQIWYIHIDNLSIFFPLTGCSDGVQKGLVFHILVLSDVPCGQRTSSCASGELFCDFPLYLPDGICLSLKCHTLFNIFYKTQWFVFNPAWVKVLFIQIFSACFFSMTLLDCFFIHPFFILVSERNYKKVNVCISISICLLCVPIVICNLMVLVSE